MSLTLGQGFCLHTLSIRIFQDSWVQMWRVWHSSGPGAGPGERTDFWHYCTFPSEPSLAYHAFDTSCWHQPIINTKKNKLPVSNKQRWFKRWYSVRVKTERIYTLLRSWKKKRFQTLHVNNFTKNKKLISQNTYKMVELQREISLILSLSSYQIYFKYESMYYFVLGV